MKNVFQEYYKARKSPEIYKFYPNLNYTSEYRFENIFFADNSEILPPLELMKNYLPHSLRASWHRDCDGELAYEFCKDRLHSEDYLFGKIGIYLQKKMQKKY